MKLDNQTLHKEPSGKRSLVTLIGLDNFEEEVIKTREPVLLLCMPQNHETQSQIDVIKRIAKVYAEELKVCLLEEVFIRTFSQKFSVRGTPTFFIFNEGIEKNRLLGQAEYETLIDFINGSLMAFPR